MCVWRGGGQGLCMEGGRQRNVGGWGGRMCVCVCVGGGVDGTEEPERARTAEIRKTKSLTAGEAWKSLF